MARLPAGHEGEPLLVRGRRVPFSFWPVRKSKARYGLQTNLFVKSPWAAMANAVDARCDAALRPAAKAFLQQAQDFYDASQANVVASKPLLLYYGFLNLAKAYILTKGVVKDLSRAKHGLQEITTTPGRILDAYVRALPAGGSNRQVFDLLSRALGNARLAAKTDYTLRVLLPQLVIGHRAWRMAANRKERFIPLHELRFYSDSSSKRVWLTIVMLKEDLKRFGFSHKKALTRSGLVANFREVQWSEEADGKPLFAFEQSSPVSYASRPSDVLLQVIDSCRSFVWPIVRTVPPYHKYYVYLVPPNEPRLHPLCSVYLLMFYLGSVTRYRPQEFSFIQESKFHVQIENFLDTYPQQFFYLLASELAQRDVCWPAVL